MCEFLSGWINVKTMDPVLADLRSHSETEKILDWKRAEIEQHREWEWTEADNGQSLSVRTSPDDAGDLGAMLRASLLARWKHRDDAVREAVFMVNDAGGLLNLTGCQLPAGLKLPAPIGGSLYLRGYRLPADIKLPASIGGSLYLTGCELPEGFKLPESIGASLDLGGCRLPVGLKLPASIGGWLNLRNCRLPESLKLPTSVNGSLYLMGCRLPVGLKLPNFVRLGIYMSGAKLYDGRPAKVIDGHIRAA